MSDPTAPDTSSLFPDIARTPLVVVTVYGLPAPQGSKRHLGRGRMVESSVHVKPWRAAVVWAARSTAACTQGAPLTIPLDAEMVFSFSRPKSHFGTGRNAGRLRANARARPSGVPDLSKLIRSTEDALTDAGVYRDDALIVGYRRAEKRYTSDAGAAPDVLDTPGAVIRLYPALVNAPTGTGAGA